MVNKKEIERLTETFPAELAPKPVALAWEQWARALRDVVAANLESSDGYDLKKSWLYDETSATFGFELTRRLVIEVEGPGLRMGTTVTAHFTYNTAGHLNVTGEIERLQRQIGAWDNALREIRQGQLATVLRRHGQSSYDTAARAS